MYDACVLYPAPLRDFLMWLALSGAFRARWSAQIHDEWKRNLSIAQGLRDASERRVVSFRWDDWKSEVAWMSLYFSVGVWTSISLIHASAPGVPIAADHGSGDPGEQARDERDQTRRRKLQKRFDFL